jgi:hypothetical protein
MPFVEGEANYSDDARWMDSDRCERVVGKRTCKWPWVYRDRAGLFVCTRHYNEDQRQMRQERQMEALEGWIPSEKPQSL